MNAEHPAPVHTRKAPAKLNLSLRVTGRRSDGFHEIDTIMVPLRGLCDVLTFAPGDGQRFTCNDARLPADDGNLVVRAARAFAEAAGVPGDMHIHLEKHIPSGAGLGGGSSDAAATLRALQEIHGEPLDRATLHGLAADLGSDVPFFLQDGPARCTGRGEIVTPVPEIMAGPLPVLLLKPDFPVATVDAYRRAMDPTLGAIPGIPMAGQEIGGIELINDLERPVFAKHRFLAELKLWLTQRPETRAVLMSGSGSTVFAILHLPHTGSADDEAPGATLARAATQELDTTLWHWQGVAG